MILKVWVEESEDYLRNLIKRQTKSLNKDKLNALLMIKMNKVSEITELAEILARNRNTVARWLSKYRKGGLENVLQTKQRETFKPLAISGDNLDKLIEKLSLPEGFNSYYHIQEWLKKECNLDVKYAAVHHTVRYKLKAKLKVARPTHIKKDKEKELAFKKTLQIK